jgi:hypothetical protein
VHTPIRAFVASFVVALVVSSAGAQQAPKYCSATAYHVLPGTHNNESGYFSLCEGLNHKLYVGAAKYGVNAFLVEFDPATANQRVVIDVNKLCGLTASGYAAQAKIHTRNFVAPASGVIYVGSKQGYPKDKSDVGPYPGGYVMTYDPASDKAQNLGMPFPGQGVADVVADESRGLTYVVTCEDQHWMLGSTKPGQPYKELGPTLTPYAMTLVDDAGRASTITKDFQLAQYDPTTQKTTVRPIEIEGNKRWTRADNSSIPTWNLTPDRKRAYLVLMNDPTLLEIDLSPAGDVVKAASHGKLLEGKNPDCRCGMALGPDGAVCAVIRVDNDTKFGAGYFHHLVRWNPKTNAKEDLGVLKVNNPDFFQWKTADGKDAPFSNGFHRLPDGTLTPMYHHMALIVDHSGTVWITIISPFTLLKVDQFKSPS